MPFRLADATLELRTPGCAVRWRATIAFADEPLSIIHLGVRGFLEFFHCHILGPEQRVTLVPQHNLPIA
jgi:hypothetical protein